MDREEEEGERELGAQIYSTLKLVQENKDKI